MSEGSFGETAMGNEEEVDKGKGDGCSGVEVEEMRRGWWVNNGSRVSSNAAPMLRALAPVRTRVWTKRLHEKRGRWWIGNECANRAGIETHPKCDQTLTQPGYLALLVYGR